MSSNAMNLRATVVVGTIPVIRREDTGGSSLDKSHSAQLSLTSGCPHKAPCVLAMVMGGGGGDCTGHRCTTGNMCRHTAGPLQGHCSVCSAAAVSVSRELQWKTEALMRREAEINCLLFWISCFQWELVANIGTTPSQPEGEERGERRE